MPTYSPTQWSGNVCARMRARLLLLVCAAGCLRQNPWFDGAADGSSDATDAPPTGGDTGGGAGGTTGDWTGAGSGGGDTSAGSESGSGSATSNGVGTATSGDAGTTSDGVTTSHGATTSGPTTGTSGTTSTPGVRQLAPLAVGNWWTYQLAGQDCGSGQATSSIDYTQQIGGRTAFALRFFCEPLVPDRWLLHNPGGQLVDRWDDDEDEWARVIDEPLQEGHSWDSLDDTTFTWQYAGTVTVPAGTFDDCWTRLGDPNDATFCPGVGRVRDMASGYSAELVDYDVQ